MGYSLLWLTLGLTAAGVWSNVVGYSVNLFPGEAFVSPDHSYRTAFLWGRLIFCVPLIVFARYIPRIQTSLTIVFAFVMSSATGAFIISYHQNLFDPVMFASTAMFVAGSGYVFMVSLFYVYLAERVKTEHAVACIATSLVLETILSVLVSLYLGSMAQACLVWVAPLIVAMCSLCARRTRVDVLRNDHRRYKTTAGKAMFIALIILFTVVMVCVRALSSTGIWGKERANFIGMTELSVGELLAISILVFLMAYVVFILPRKRFSLSLRCIFGLVVMIAGLQMLALANDFQFGLSFDVVTTAVELFSHLAKWMIVIECIRKTDVPPFRVACISGPVYAVVSLLWVSYLEQLDVMISSLVMILMYSLFVAVGAILLFMERSGKGFFSGSDSDETLLGASSESLSSFAKRWHLSARETEIVDLLLLGMKRSDIEQRCGLSEGTVKTHISNIYRKLDVHSKGEMRDLFESEVDSDTE